MENEMLDDNRAASAWLRPGSTPPLKHPQPRRQASDAICSRAVKSGVWGKLLAHGARRLDAYLRKKQGIFEFCDHPQCILRVALRLAAANMTLSDKLQLRQGDIIAELHLWNEHIPKILGAGPNLSWAVLAQRRMRQSLTLLADHVRSDPRLNEVRVFHAHGLFGTGKSQTRMQRFAKLHGFELGHAQIPAGWLDRLRNLGECLHQWAMIRAFNPGALAGRHLINVTHHQLWISREALLAKFPTALPKIQIQSDRTKPASVRMT